MFLEEVYINEIAKQQAKKIDETIIEFAKSLGFELKEPYIDDFIEIQRKLSETDSFIRCEVFSRTKTSNDPTAISFETRIYPFLDSLSNPIPISEVKRILNLGSEWF